MTVSIQPRVVFTISAAREYHYELFYTRWYSREQYRVSSSHLCYSREQYRVSSSHVWYSQVLPRVGITTIWYSRDRLRVSTATCGSHNLGCA